MGAAKPSQTRSGRDTFNDMHSKGCKRIFSRHGSSFSARTGTSLNWHQPELASAHSLLAPDGTCKSLPSKGRRPHSSANRMTPMDHTSSGGPALEVPRKTWKKKSPTARKMLSHTSFASSRQASHVQAVFGPVDSSWQCAYSEFIFRK